MVLDLFCLYTCERVAHYFIWSGFTLSLHKAQHIPLELGRCTMPDPSNPPLPLPQQDHQSDTITLQPFQKPQSLFECHSLPSTSKIRATQARKNPGHLVLLLPAYYLTIASVFMFEEHTDIGPDKYWCTIMVIRYSICTKQFAGGWVIRFILLHKFN